MAKKKCGDQWRSFASAVVVNNQTETETEPPKKKTFLRKTAAQNYAYSLGASEKDEP